jgi:ankyrin repeat protein
LVFSQSCGYRSAQERAATPRVEDTPRGEMLMPPSEPVADANDLPREVHIELQQMVEDAQQEEDHNPAPPSQPTGSTPFDPPAENDQGNNIASDSELTIAVCSGRIATVRKLLESSVGTVNERCGEGGQFALMHAATLGHTAIVQALLEASASVDLLCNGGRTALRWAARNGHTSVVLALLEASASVDLRSNGQAGFTALMWAAWYGRTAIVRALLQASASVGLQSKLGYTALMIAARNGHTAIVQVLLQASASVDLRSNAGNTALAFARERNNATAILLLQRDSLRTCRAFGQRARAAAARIGTTVTGKQVDQRVRVIPAEVAVTTSAGGDL